MRFFIFVIVGLLLTIKLEAQTITEKIASKACNCLDSLKTDEPLNSNLKDCISEATAYYMTNGSTEEQNFLKSFQGAVATLTEVYEIIPSQCYTLRHLLIEEKRQKYYKLSGNSDANAYYQKGNDFMDKGDFKNSIIEFKKALNLDNSFVYALDHLAFSYRNLNNLEIAIQYYQKSLVIFPEGEVALLNIANAYSLLRDYRNSKNYFKDFIYYYQDNPEGYFGLGKILFIKKDYENALENIFIAHQMYEKTNSDNLSDCDKFISLMYSELKKIDKLDLFDIKAKKYNIIVKE